MSVIPEDNLDGIRFFQTVPCNYIYIFFKDSFEGSLGVCFLVVKIFQQVQVKTGYTDNSSLVPKFLNHTKSSIVYCSVAIIFELGKCYHNH
jgi:hypothetical protein